MLWWGVVEPEDFSSVMITDAELLRQRLALNELVLIRNDPDYSALAVPFSQAVHAGGKRYRWITIMNLWVRWISDVRVIIALIHWLWLYSIVMMQPVRWRNLSNRRFEEAPFSAIVFCSG